VAVRSSKGSGFAPVPEVCLAAYVRNLHIEDDFMLTNRQDRMEPVFEDKEG
jgi:hypothetical protein